jgi:hypothetical protein
LTQAPQSPVNQETREVRYCSRGGRWPIDWPFGLLSFDPRMSGSLFIPREKFMGEAPEEARKLRTVGHRSPPSSRLSRSTSEERRDPHETELESCLPRMRIYSTPQSWEVDARNDNPKSWVLATKNVGSKESQSLVLIDYFARVAKLNCHLPDHCFGCVIERYLLLELNT